MRRLTFLLLCLFIGIGLSAQTRVTGTVLSTEDGQPVIGAAVVVKGTTTGTVTDYDGKFQLSVPTGGKFLTISFMGMDAQEVAVQPTVLVRLSAHTEALSEIVVVALGISKEKKALGYAVQDVKGDALTKGANTSLAGALQGKVAGVEITSGSGMPGASSKLTIRGSRSFTGDNTPLYVIDGMPVASTSDIGTGNSVTGTDFANRAVDIDPNDIESINVLKGQAASALYGLRASNGVIVITTKSGKGMAKGKAQVSFSSNLAFDVISRTIETQTKYAQGSAGVFNPMASTSWGPRISELPNDSRYGGNVANDLNGGTLRQGQYYVPQRANAGLDPWVTPQVYDNIGDFFGTGVNWSNSVNVAQAFDKGSYSFTLGNTTQDGIVPGTGMDRYNAKLVAEARLTDNWTTGFSGNFVNSKINKMPTANNGLVATIYPAPPSYDLKGIPSSYAGNPYKQNTYRSTGGFNAAYWAVDNVEFTEKNNRFFGNAYANYKTNFNTKNHTLNVKYQMGADAYTTNYSDVWGYGHANGLGLVENQGVSSTTFNSLATAAYNWKISTNWAVDALLGSELVHQNFDSHYQYGADFNFAGWNHINNTVTQQTQDTYRQNRTVGFFGSVSASYRGILYMNATGRNDFVSTMPRGSRSFFYPSVSAGLVLTELEPLKNDVLTFAKIRGSYAEVGQAGTYYPAFYSIPSYGGGFSSGTPIIYPIDKVSAYIQSNTVYDPNLKPQNTQSYEVGADLVFLNGVVSANYTFSRQNVKDQIFPVPLPASTGSGSFITNGGRVHTNAHELTLDVTPIRKKNIEWSFGMNWSKIDNYVDELAPGVESIFLGGFVTPQVRAGIGEKFPVIYGASYLRDDKGNLIVDSKGLPQAGESKVIGSIAPDFIMGFNTQLMVYGVRISAVFDWKQGGQMYSGTTGLMDFYGMSKVTENRETMKFVVPGVKADGSKNDVEISGANNIQGYYSRLNDIDESMIYNNSYLKLRELSVSYPVVKTKALSVDLNVFARNLLLWTNLEGGIDPESSQGNTNMAGAFERFSLPQTSSYGFGLNFKF